MSDRHLVTTKSNNFDLIRLAAALQVAVVHLLHHQGLDSDHNILTVLARYFPGVPIFFFVSGFLISQSFDRNPSLADFTLNRCLRIYPALIVCFLVSILSVYAAGYFRIQSPGLISFASWAAAQLSFLQFYNPDFMRHYGTGVLNGSVWTIGVELQFYALIPLIYWLMHSRRWGRMSANNLCLTLILVFIVANRIYSMQIPTLSASIFFKLAGVTFIPWVYMFLTGVFVQHNFSWFHSRLSGKFLIVLAVYGAIAVLTERWLGWGFGNSINPILFFALVAAGFTAAFSNPTLSDLVLRRNDISYGVYVYHMPVINFFLAIGWGASIEAFWGAMLATLGLALMSWLIIEKPALTLKKHPLYRHVTENRDKIVR
jgi:peptidoglycan/LPS O-acetylase OafA/YrhL